MASPLPVQARLTAAGMRPVSPIVDATNYVMLETGQPLHAFDLDRLAGPRIEVRRARAGERIVTLDDVERTLTDDDLLICDAERPVAIAGVMGAAIAEVSDATSRVLLESATFERGGIQRTRRRLGLSTEASMRFERGVDPEVTGFAADRVCHLLQVWGEMEVAPDVVAAGSVPERRRIRVRPSRASLLIGHDVPIDDARGVFGRLGMPHRDDGDALEVEVPGYRVDIEREADLIEEIARVQGYERVGSRLPAIAQVGGVPPAYALRERMRDSLVRAGLREVRLIPFVSREDLAISGDDVAVPVVNPLAADEGWLRTRLLPGLLAAAQRNLARQVPGVALFEVGTVFHLDAGGRAVERHNVVGIVFAGSAPDAWDAPRRSHDVLDAKGAIASLLDDLGIGWSMGDAPGHPAHPGRSATVVVEGRAVGWFGEVHPRIAERRGLPGRVAVAEIDVASLVGSADGGATVHDVPRFPPLRRDLAFVVPDSARAGEVAACIATAGGGLVSSVHLFDVFEGGAIGEGRRSLAFAVELRADDRTLTDEDAATVVEAIRAAVATDFAGELRAG